MDRRLAFLVVVALAVVATAGTGVAGAQSADCEAAFDRTGTFLDRWNANADAIPGFVRDRIADETIHVVVRLDEGGRCHATGVTDGEARFTELEPGTPDDPTLRWVTDEATIREVATAENPRQAAIASFRAGEHDLRPTENTGAVDRVALGAVDTVTAVTEFARKVGDGIGNTVASARDLVGGLL